MAKFEDFVATATAMGGNDLSRGWLKELWEGADSDMNRAINHLLDTPEDKYKRDSKKSSSSTSKPSGHKKSKRGSGSTGGGGGNVNTFPDYTSSTGGLVGDRNHAGGGGGSAAANIPDLSSFFDFPQTSELDQSEQAPAGMAGISSGGATGAGRTMMDGGQGQHGGAGATAMNANASMMGGAAAAPGGGLFGVASTTMGGDMGMSMGGAGAGAYFGQQSMAPGMMGAQHQSMAGAHMNMSMAPPPPGTASSMAGGEQFPQAAVNFQQPNYIHSMGAGAGNFTATIPPQGFAAAEHNNFQETPVMNNNPGGGMFGTTTPGAPGFFPHQPAPGSAASGPGAGGALGPPPSSGSMLGTTSTTTLPPGMSSGQHPILADVLQMPPSVQQAMMQQLDPSYQHGPSYVPPPVAAAGPGAGAGAAGAAPGLASGSYTTMNAAASTTQPHVLSPTHAWQQSGLPPVQHPLMSEAEKNFWLFQQNGFQLPGGLFQQNVPQSAPALGGGVAVGAGAPGPQQQLPASLGNLAPAQQAPMSAADLGIMQQLYPGGGSFLVHPPQQQQVHQRQQMHQTIAPSSSAALTSAAQQPSTPSAAQQLQQLQLLQAQQHNLNQQAALYSSLAQHPSGHPVSITTSAPGSPTATSLVRGSVEVGSPLAQQRQEHLQLQVMQQQKMLHNMRNIVLMQNSRLSSLKRKEPADGGSGSQPGAGDAGAEEKDGGEWWTGGTLSGGAGGQALGGAESKNPFADAAPSGRSASNTPRLSHRETVLRNQMKRSASLTPSRKVRGAAAGLWQLNPGPTWMQLAAETPPRGGAGAGAAMSSNPRLALPFPGGTVGAQPQTQSVLGSSHLVAGRGVQSSAPPGGPFYVAQNQTQMEHLGSPQLVASTIPQPMQRSLSPAPPPYYSSPYLASQLPQSATRLTQSIPVAAPYAGYGPAAPPMFAQSVIM